MKKTLLILLLIGIVGFFAWLTLEQPSGARTVVRPSQGGTGTSTTDVAGAVLIYNATTGLYEPTTITQGSGMTITNADGSISLASSGGSGVSDWNKQTNFGVLTLTATTTIPYWAKSAIYASSTLDVDSTITFGNITNCDTIDTDANGVLSCGTDATGSGGGVFAWTPQADGNATSTNLIFKGGFLSTASSTINSTLRVIGSLIGTLTGNADTATTLQTARTIAGVSFNGSANISLNNNAITNGAGYTTNTGTVTSVTQTVPTGLTISGSPVTTSGTLAIGLDTGRVIPLQSTLDGYLTLSSWFATTTQALISSLPSLFITESQISDLTHTVDTNTQLSQEQVEDFAGSMVATGGTKTGITVTYQDATNDMDFVTDVQTADLHSAVTLAGTPNYLTIVGQVITQGLIDLTADITGNLPVANLNSGTSASATTYWRGDGSWATPAGSGTVTSVAQTVPTGFTISGTPITTSGTLAIGYGAGYSSAGLLTASTTEWATAYGWGDHSVAGYLTGNQSITLSGDVTGSGTTAITTTIGALRVVGSMIANATIDLTSKVTGLLPTANIVDAFILNTGDIITGALTFSGITNDITTGMDEHLNIVPNGTGRVGIASSTPSSLFAVSGTTTMQTLNINNPSSTGTSTMYIYSNDAGVFGGEIILEDSDSLGCTALYALNGTITGTTVTCPSKPTSG